jgi:hypothetical protein
MAGFKLDEAWTVAGVAGEDLSAKVNYLVKMNSSGEIVLAGANEKALGTLFEAGPAGAAVSVAMGSILKVVASAAIAKGARVNVAAGGLGVTGTTNPVGVALSSCANALEVISVAAVA